MGAVRVENDVDHRYVRSKSLKRLSSPALALPSALERRRSFRVEVTAHALLWHKGQFAGRYAIADLSIGGCRLAGGAPREPGDEVEVLLRIPHRGALSLSATVLRSIDLGKDRAALALRFGERTPTAEDWIHDVVLWALEGARVDARRTSLVLVDDPARAHRLADMLRDMGRPAIAASTPLDAVQLIVEQCAHVDVVLIDERLGGGRGLELAEFLRHNHPAVHRIVLGASERSLALLDAQNCGTVEGVLDATPSAKQLEKLLLRLGCWMPLADGIADC